VNYIVARKFRSTFHLSLELSSASEKRATRAARTKKVVAASQRPIGWIARDPARGMDRSIGRSLAAVNAGDRAAPLNAPGETKVFGRASDKFRGSRG